MTCAFKNPYWLNASRSLLCSTHLTPKTLRCINGHSLLNQFATFYSKIDFLLFIFWSDLLQQHFQFDFSIHILFHSLFFSPGSIKPFSMFSFFISSHSPSQNHYNNLQSPSRDRQAKNMQPKIFTSNFNCVVPIYTP